MFIALLPRTCAELRDKETNPTSGVYPIDIDGYGPLEKTMVWCNISSPKGNQHIYEHSMWENDASFIKINTTAEAWTVIEHNFKENTIVKNYSDYAHETHILYR